jgi:hypothetical protein
MSTNSCMIAGICSASPATDGRLSDDLRSALEAAGVEFTNGDQPGVRLRKAP